MPRKKKNKKHSTQRRMPPGWLSSDADEIERRRLRGLDELSQIVSYEPGDDFYNVYEISSNTGQSYHVEIRSLDQKLNTCDCPDHRINGLGTCKHIEATLIRLQHRRKRAFRKAATDGSPFIEIFLDRVDDQVRILWPKSRLQFSKARGLLVAFFTKDNILAGNPLDVLPAMLRNLSLSHSVSRRKIKISRELTPWLETLDRRQQQIRNRRHFETEVTSGSASLDLVKLPLYPYQQEGMLHLAFNCRALLADEMGLGKTAQAIAACELLRRTMDVRRVLVISPASLKGEWEEQITKFTDLSSLIIQGTRAKRLRQYEEPAFFYLANYEQIRLDVEDINTTLRPDVIILDEAQRIKNWQTKTAISIKRLRSPYAFVLTGTPVENRIDEIYSIIQFLDPQIFGPLFRFNRDFYELDESGRAIGYRNLNQLHEMLKPIMLRRRKEEVEGQLPERTLKTYFVPMHDEQKVRYEEYETKVARLAAIARNRPLKKEEMERLQQYLACMRMLCDTPYILDKHCRISPKLKELGDILGEIMADGDHKVIIFSEWQGMLDLVRDLAEQMALGYAWHTGKVTLPKRREEIRRFKGDSECRLLLSTDSGSVGLNLQVADVVINLDIPWNPARLEQRIARAWRKHQKRLVQVINLVTECSIEHRMLTLLEQKRSLIEGVVDGRGKNEMSLPSGRAAFLDRLDALVDNGKKANEPLPAVSPRDRLLADLLPRWESQLNLMELHEQGDQRTLLVVVDSLAGDLEKDFSSHMTQALKKHFPQSTPQLKLLDRPTYETIQQLIESGLLRADVGSKSVLYRAHTSDTPKQDLRAKCLAAAQNRMAESEHKHRMANVLGNGGFVTEALVPMRESLEIALHSLALWRDQEVELPLSLSLVDSMLVQTNLLPGDILPMISQLREDQPGRDESQAHNLLAVNEHVLSQCATLLKTKH